MMRSFDELLDQARRLPRTRIAVVAPANEETFGAIRDALGSLPAEFFLAGDEGLIRKSVGTTDRVTVHASPDPPAALAACLQAVRQGSATVLMKGSIDTGTMMKGALDAASGIRTGRLMSDVFIFEYPRAAKLLMITDGGLTIAPTLAEKAELIRNAVMVAQALGNPAPKVAVLSATEKVTRAMPSTLDAAELAAMNRRGEITGCVVDGPVRAGQRRRYRSREGKGDHLPRCRERRHSAAPDHRGGQRSGEEHDLFRRLPACTRGGGGDDPDPDPLTRGQERCETALDRPRYVDGRSGQAHARLILRALPRTLPP